MDSIKLVHSKTRRAYNLAARTYHDLFREELRQKAYDKRLLKSFAGRFGRESVICDSGCGPSAPPVAPFSATRTISEPPSDYRRG